MRIRPIVLLMVGLSCAAHADDSASVLVKTVPIRRQALAHGLSGYGIVGPGIGAAVNVSLPRAGQIERMLVMQGQAAQHGETLFVFITDPVSANAYAQAKSSLEFARNDYARVNRLFEQQLATGAQVAAAKKVLRDAESAVREQERQGSGLRQARVMAPFDGIVSALYAAQGDRIQPGKAVLQFVRRGAWRAQIGLQPEDISSVKPGMPVTLHPVLQPELQLQGVVERVNAMPDPQTQLVNVSVKVTSGPALVPGMAVRGVIQVQSTSAWVVPSSAVLSDERGAYIYQDDHGRARRVDVTAREDGALTGVAGPVDPKLPVVVLGNYELRDGMALREGAP